LNLEIVEKLSESQTLELMELFSKEWWSNNRKSDDVRRMLQKTDLIIGMIDKDSGQLVAFSRILTDFVYRAMIYDVIVRKSFRHKELGSELIKLIVRHPLLKSVEYIELQTQPDLISYYEQFGFSKSIVGCMHTLRIVNKISD